MGEVWLADQKYPIRRRVAIKLIRSGMGLAVAAIHRTRLTVVGL